VTRPSCKHVALVALGGVVGALFVTWAALPIVAEFVGSYRRGKVTAALPDLLAPDGGGRP